MEPKDSIDATPEQQQQEPTEDRRRPGRPARRKVPGPSGRSDRQNKVLSEEARLAKFRRMDAHLRREVKCMDDPPLHRAHRWGCWFSFICKHRMWRCLKLKDLDALCQAHYGIHDTAAYDYIKLFRTIPMPWIEEAGRDVPHKDAMLIVGMKPAPPDWIRRTLWDCLVREKCRFAEMKRIVDGVQAALEALEGKDPPGEQWLRQVLEGARREDPTETIKRELDMLSKDMARIVKGLVNVRDMLEDLEDVDMEALKEGFAEVWRGHEEMNKELDRLLGMLKRTRTS